MHKAREIGCEFVLIDGRWKMRGPRTTPKGLLDLVDAHLTAICAELSRPRTTDEIVKSQADAMLSKRRPIWTPNANA